MADYDGTRGEFSETLILSVGTQFFYIQIRYIEPLFLGGFTKQLVVIYIWTTEEASF